MIITIKLFIATDGWRRRRGMEGVYGGVGWRVREEGGCSWNSIEYIQ